MAELDAVFDALPDAVVEVDSEGRIARANAAAHELLGGPSLAGRPLEEVAPLLARMVGRADRTARRGRVVIGDLEVEARAAPLAEGGWALVLRGPGRIAGLASVGRETRRLMELVAGLAHELRNPLAGLKGAADLLAREVGEGDLLPYAEVISRESIRLDALVRQLLDLARPRAPATEPQNLHRILDEVLLLSEESLPTSVRVVRRYDPSLPPLAVDRDQLVQVLLNLVRNAGEAMIEGGGELAVTTGIAVGITSRGAGGHRSMARLEVADTGPGLDPEVVEHLFTPFVTTKATGTGLGLALCRRIVEAHGGLLEVRDRESGGVCASVYLPVPATETRS